MLLWLSLALGKFGMKNNLPLSMSRRHTLAHLLCSTAWTRFLPLGLMLATPGNVAQAEENEMSRDQRDGEIISQINSQLKELGIKTVTGIGPVDEEGNTCVVFMVGKDQVDIPKKLEIKLSNEKQQSVSLDFQEAEERAELFNGTFGFPLPLQHSGPMMGGDPIWNNNGAYFGTITFAADMGSPIMIEGYSCANECVSCNHALYVAGQTTISTSKKKDSMSLTWNIVPPSGLFWIDVAGATINSGIPFTALEVRGLGGIKATKQPTTGIRVSKYGAATGLTSGRDGGIALKEVDHVSHPYEMFTVRMVQGPFSAKGDSGAAVLDADRNFVGIVFSGITNETYYLHALPNGQAPPDQNLSKVTIAGL
jgi:hypothetical protein